MQELIKFISTIFTVISVFISSLAPVTVKPKTENFDFSFLEYPEEAIITLEEAEGFEMKNIEFKNITYSSYMRSKIEGNEHPNTVQISLENIRANGTRVAWKGLRFIVGWSCDVDFTR